ncbi:vomeronasal type-2 receptor 26-like [Discoglossus pictus]
MNPDFNDRIHFPYIYRTVPDDYSQVKVIIQLLIHFGWTWVGIIASNDDSNLHASEELKKELKKIGICVAFLAVISHKPDDNKASIRKVAEVINNSSVNVIISFCSSSSFIGLLEGRMCRVTSRKLWIASMALNIITDERFQNYLHAFNGSLLISVHKGEIKGFKNFLYRPTWYNIPDIIFLKDIWNFNFECTNILPNDIPKKHCSKEEKWNESLTQVESNTCHFTHAIYIAVYALAQALHDMHLSTRILEQSAEKTSAKIRLKLNNYLQNGHFKIASGQEFSFNEEGYISGRFYIQNWVIYTNGTIEKYYIGSFSSINQKFYINESAIIWGPQFNQTPTSVCTETCPSGFRKAPQIGKPACCFDCIPCSEGEITNSTVDANASMQISWIPAHCADMENCVKCPEDQWSNANRDQCIKRSIDFLSYDHLLGTALSCFASIFLLITTGVLWILIKYGSTPIVKVNNQKLSFILLLSLMGSYTCSFLFIGQPMELTCLLRHVTIGFFFTVAISSVLGKTVTVVIAFNATKPGSKLKKWVGSRMSVGLVLVCSLGEIVICITWLICSPPFVDTDTKSTLGTIIVQCNEGSTIAFYLAVSYIAVLALFSFSVAFIVRKLPDSFNESKYITFSMLVFCSVWVTFVPTYLSTKGKYMVGVEVFSILASSSGILICIFAPKCYIILLKPELNKKQSLKLKTKPNKLSTSFWYLQHLLAFIYAIEVINESTDILPNITLGFQIYDACTSEVIALMSTLSIISEKEQPIPNFICQKEQRTVAFIGHISSSPSYTMSQITQLYGYSQRCNQKNIMQLIEGITTFFASESNDNKKKFETIS